MRRKKLWYIWEGVKQLSLKHIKNEQNELLCMSVIEKQFSFEDVQSDKDIYSSNRW